MKFTWKMFNDEINEMLNEAKKGTLLSSSEKQILKILKYRLKKKMLRSKRKRCKNCLCPLLISSIDRYGEKVYIHYSGKTCKCGCKNPEPEKEAGKK